MIGIVVMALGMCYYIHLFELNHEKARQALRSANLALEYSSLEGSANSDTHAATTDDERP